MQQAESILESETNKVVWDFVIQKDHQILTQRPVIINKTKKKKKKKKRKEKELAKYWTLLFRLTTG